MANRRDAVTVPIDEEAMSERALPSISKELRGAGERRSNESFQKLIAV